MQSTYGQYGINACGEQSIETLVETGSASHLWLRGCHIPAGANWETLFGFYFEEDIPIKVHIYFIGKEFDLDKLSDMIYSLFTDTEEDHIKINKIAFKYNKGVKPDKTAEKAIIEDIETGKKKFDEKFES